MTKSALEAGITRAKNARQKRKLTNEAPKVVENTKSTIFIKGGNVSDVITNVFKDLHVLKVHVFYLTLFCDMILNNNWILTVPFV